MKQVQHIFFSSIFTASFLLHGISLDRVILATDANPNYIQFWPMVAQAWQEIVGVRPTLIVVAPSDIKVDESLGDVIYFEPIEGIPTSYQAQVIRLFAPALFPEDTCIISDIDMLPLQESYFKEEIKCVNEDHFIIYRDRASAWYEERTMYPMCYVAAKGKIFAEIFSVNEETIKDKLIEWHGLGLGWVTDEIMMARSVQQWQHCPKSVCKLGRCGGQSIDRLAWGYDIRQLKRHVLVDAHLLRPYVKNKKVLDKLFIDLGLKSRISAISVMPFSPSIARKKHPCGDFAATGEKEIINKLIKDGDVVIDVGANNGMWTNEVLTHHDPSILIAFEPIKECAATIMCRSNIRVENMAISNIKGFLSFYKYPTEDVLSSLYQRDRVEQMLHIKPEIITVSVNTLSNYAAEHNLPFIHMLKIDVEGAEIDVLEGSRQLLQMHQIAMIQFEYGSTYIDSKKNLHQVMQLLSEYGYVVFKILPNGLMHIPNWTSILEDYYQSNYLAVAPQYAYGWNSIVCRK